MDNPFELITCWDFLILFLGVFIRFLLTMKHKLREFEETFRFSKYFDARHITRWIIHLTSAVTGLLVLPEILESYIIPKYIPDLESWALLGSAMVGFIGYDLVKFTEKITFKILSREKLD